MGILCWQKNAIISSLYFYFLFNIKKKCLKRELNRWLTRKIKLWIENNLGQLLARFDLVKKIHSQNKPHLRKYYWDLHDVFYLYCISNLINRNCLLWCQYIIKQLYWSAFQKVIKKKYSIPPLLSYLYHLRGATILDFLWGYSLCLGWKLTSQDYHIFNSIDIKLVGNL